MIEQHQIRFDKLAKDKEDSTKTLEKPSMRGTIIANPFNNTIYS